MKLYSTRQRHSGKGTLSKREKLSTVDLLVLNSCFLYFKYSLPFYQTSILNKEANGMKPSHSLVFLDLIQRNPP